MDGATDIEQFRFITLPSLRPIMAVTVLLSIIFSLKSVDFQYIMTYGGPADSTKVVAFEAYFLHRVRRIPLRQGFGDRDDPDADHRRQQSSTYLEAAGLGMTAEATGVAAWTRLI